MGLSIVPPSSRVCGRRGRRMGARQSSTVGHEEPKMTVDTSAACDARAVEDEEMTREDDSSDDEWRALIDGVKRKERTDLGLPDWQKYGFATRRARDFEALASAGDEPPNAVPRVQAKGLSVEEFSERYEKRGLPCLLQGIPELEGWPAWEGWAADKLCERFADVPFKVGKADDGQPIRLKLRFFAKYLQRQMDDSPLYVFDNRFGGRTDVREELLKEYAVPSYFPDDYMAVAGEEGRPPYRWVAVGPKRSGTVMHQDPLCTNAWNTLLQGRKRWVLLDPGVPRAVAKARHVMNKDDDDEAVNVFVDLLPRLRKEGVKTVEFVQYPGETVFLPGGWWHCVVNIDDTVAVTHNYAGRHNFAAVWRSARSERPCWSNRWLRALSEQLPAVAEKAQQLNAEDGFDMSKLLQLNRERRRRRRERRELRDLRRARGKAGKSFDEAAWRRKRTENMSASDSDSTVSTSSSASSMSTASSSDESGDSVRR